MEFKVFKSEPRSSLAKKDKLRLPRYQALSVELKYEELEALYRYNMSFFGTLPNYTVSLQEFEDYALDRLKLLRTMERINLTSVQKYSREWKSAVKAELEKQNLHYYNLLWRGANTTDVLLARKLDHISHYVLRLAFCRTDELRKWVITQEMEFFRFKFSHETSARVIEFLKANNFPYQKVAEEEKKELKSELYNGTFFLGVGMTIDQSQFFKVPFINALELVKGRKVYMENGYAYVPFNDIISIVCSVFRSQLSKALVLTNKLLPQLENDERLVQLLTDFDKRHTGADYVASGNSHLITANMLPQLSNKSFPLCMKSLHGSVTTDFHLKHWGRLQLGLFFKGVGLPMEEAIKFWRYYFTQKAGVDGSRFDKQYLYGIRHQYGKEGKRADYTPYSCMKIIMSSVGPGENHGCPFRHSDAKPLRDRLAAADIPNEGIREIMNLVQQHHYQIACQKYFEWTHSKMTIEGGLNHPNQYFEESQKVLAGKFTVKTEANAVKTTRTVVYPDGRSSSEQQINGRSIKNNEEQMEVEEPGNEIGDDEMDMYIVHGKFRSRYSLAQLKLKLYLLDWISSFFGKYEEPTYESIRNITDTIEERLYHSSYWACFEEFAEDEKDAKSSEMFMSLFSYIRGQNENSKTIDMTVPVAIKVDHRNGKLNSYEMCFHLPEDIQQSSTSPPKSTNSNVHILKFPTLTIFSKQFGGYTTPQMNQEQLTELKSTLKNQSIPYYEDDIGNRATYFVNAYDSPTKFWNRRNEIWLLGKETSSKAFLNPQHPLYPFTIRI